MKAKRLLAIMLLLPCLLTGCNLSGGDDTTSTEASTTVTTPTDGTTSADNTTPADNDYTVPDENTMALTHVTITAGDTPAEGTAVAELTKYLEKRSITVGEGGFPIRLTINAELGDDAYRIDAVIDGDDVGMTIAGGNGRGVLYGVYGFLEKYAGLRSYTPTLEVYPTEGDIAIPEGTLIEYTPVFEMRMNDWYKWAVGNKDTFYWCVKNGVNIIDGWWDSWDVNLGGSLEYCGGTMFVHTLGSLTGTGGGASPNPCLTDPNNLAKAKAAVRAKLAERPETAILSVSQNDADQCRCANCLASDAKYGSPAGTILSFVNEIATDIAQDYPNVTIDTLAYAYSQTPPTGIAPAENVCIRLCSITCNFSHPLNDPSCPENAKFCRDLEGWSEICDNIYIWDYTTNFAFYIPTFANLHVLQANMQYFAEHNVKGMFTQGNRNSPSGEFGELRAFLLSRLMMNPYMTEEEYYGLMDEFLQAYYGDGWAYIRMYIDKTSEMYSAYCGTIYTHPLALVPAEEFKEMQQAFTEWWARAEELADEARVDNVKRSGLQWRFFLARFDSSLQPAFEQEVRDLGIYWSEDNWQYSRW